MNEQLVNTLKVLLATTVDASHRAHGYHWNVEGDDFHQYHELFGAIYDSLDGAVDPLAEWIRMLDVNSYAPFRLNRFIELSVLPDTEVTANPLDMAKDLCEILDIVIIGFKNAGTEATAAQEYSLANFYADQQGAAQKWCWQLRASLKEVGE